MGLSILEGVAKASSMILVSEIGDKTFFLAALMAMRHPRRWVMAGSLSALWIMTLLSAFLGWAAPNLLPRKWTHILATLLFLGFGVRSLWDGIFMGSDNARAEEEMREVEAQLDESDKKEEEGDDPARETISQNGPPAEHAKEQLGQRSHIGANGTVNGVITTATKRAMDSTARTEGKEPVDQQPQVSKSESKLSRHLFISPVFFQAFSLVFFGEWGDKSQIATIGLASEENVWGVALGGCLGHFICNGAAVLGGRQMASMISERMVAIFGGVLFLLFAAQSWLGGPHV